jgi:hypothetical protein
MTTIFIINKKIKNCPKDHQFFASSFTKTMGSTRIMNWNWQFFDSEVFSKPKTDNSLKVQRTAQPWS